MLCITTRIIICDAARSTMHQAGQLGLCTCSGMLLCHQFDLSAACLCSLQ